MLCFTNKKTKFIHWLSTVLLMCLITTAVMPVQWARAAQQVTGPTPTPEAPPGFEGDQDDGAGDHGEHLDFTDTTIYFAFYNTYEYTVLSYNGTTETIENTDLGQDATWLDVYYLVQEVHSDWNKEILRDTTGTLQVTFEIQKVIQICTFPNTVVGRDDQGRALYSTHGATSHWCYSPQEAVQTWNSLRAQYESTAREYPGEHYFTGSNRNGWYDHSSLNNGPSGPAPGAMPPTPEPTPEPTATPVPTTGPAPTGVPATSTPTPVPTSTPTPTATSTPTPTPKPTATFTPTPTPASGGIVYYSNGADKGYTHRDTKRYGGTFIVSGNTFFEKYGYHWTHWNTNKNGWGVPNPKGPPCVPFCICFLRVLCFLAVLTGHNNRRNPKTHQRHGYFERRFHRNADFVCK